MSFDHNMEISFNKNTLLLGILYAAPSEPASFLIITIEPLNV